MTQSQRDEPRQRNDDDTAPWGGGARLLHFRRSSRMETRQSAALGYAVFVVRALRWQPDGEVYRVRAFVLGSQGYLGRHIVAQDISWGSVVPVSRSEMQMGARSVAAIGNPSQGEVAVLINAAGVRSASLAERDPDAVNFGQQELLRYVNDLARVVRPRAIIHCGSSSVYGECTSPVKESREVQPTGTYGRIQFETELAMAAIAEQHGAELRVARIFNVTGCAASQTLRNGDGGAPRALLEGALREGAVVISGRDPEGGSVERSEGTPIRDFIDVRDVAESILAMAELSSCPPVVNIASGLPRTLDEVATAVESIVRRPIVRRYIQQAPNEPFASKADVSVMHEYLAPARHNLGDSLRSMLPVVEAFASR